VLCKLAVDLLGCVISLLLEFFLYWLGEYRYSFGFMMLGLITTFGVFVVLSWEFILFSIEDFLCGE